MRHTPLYEEHKARGGKMVDFYGWALPVQYTGIVQEHLHTRAKVSLFDCSHMGEFRITSSDAVRQYDKLVLSDVDAIPVGRGRYGAILNESGGIIDDCITIKLGEDELYVVTNAGPLDMVSAIITADNPGAEDVSSQTAKIDVQGPLARDILLAAGFAAAAELRYFSVTLTEWGGGEVVLSRTGYTGELGYELFMPTIIAVALWRELSDQDDVEPAGLGARDTLRTEMGYGLSGQDFDQARTPLEARLDRFIAWDSDFTGKEALEAQQRAGGYPVLTAIRTRDRRAPRHSFEVRANNEVVGAVTSGTFGPSVGHGIGLAYVPENLAKPGTRLTAGPKGLPLETVELPFYKTGSFRN